MARKATKQLEDQGYSALDAYCIGVYEYYKSLLKAGFTDDLALAIIIEPSSYPRWILPDEIPPEKLGDYEDEDDD
jgi:hypothetical protein